MTQVLEEYNHRSTSINDETFTVSKRDDDTGGSGGKLIVIHRFEDELFSSSIGFVVDDLFLGSQTVLTADKDAIKSIIKVLQGFVDEGS